MLRDLNVSSDGRRDSGTPFVGRLASEIPIGGNFPAWLLNDLDAAYPERRYRVEVLTLPSAGVLYLDDRGVGSFTGAPAGTYTGTQRIEKFDPGVGRVSSIDTTYTISILALNITDERLAMAKLDATQFINQMQISHRAQRALASLVDSLISDIKQIRDAQILMAQKLDADAGVTAADFVSTATVPEANVILGK